MIQFKGLTEQRLAASAEARRLGGEVQREDFAQEFKTVLQQQIGSNASLAIGSFDPK